MYARLPRHPDCRDRCMVSCHTSVLLFACGAYKTRLQSRGVLLSFFLLPLDSSHGFFYTLGLDVYITDILANATGLPLLDQAATCRSLRCSVTGLRRHCLRFPRRTSDCQQLEQITIHDPHLVNTGRSIAQQVAPLQQCRPSKAFRFATLGHHPTPTRYTSVPPRPSTLLLCPHAATPYSTAFFHRHKSDIRTSPRRSSRLVSD